MIACIHSLGVGTAGPVEEVSPHGIITLGIYALIYQVHETQDIVTVLLQIFLVPEPHVPVILDDEIP